MFQSIASTSVVMVLEAFSLSESLSSSSLSSIIDGNASRFTVTGLMRMTLELNTASLVDGGGDVTVVVAVGDAKSVEDLCGYAGALLDGVALGDHGV